MSEKFFAVESRAGARPGQRVLRVAGRVDLETVPRFLQALRSEQAPAIILDLSGVSYVDSGGVGALVQTYSSFRKTDRRLALVALNPRVQAVLELTRLHKIFAVFPTVAEAEKLLS